MDEDEKYMAHNVPTTCHWDCYVPPQSDLLDTYDLTNDSDFKEIG